MRRRCSARTTVFQDSLDGGTGHLAAFVRATSACFGAALAMIMLMLHALFSAGVANLGTQFAGTADELGATAHVGCGCPASLGAIAIQADAMCQLRDAFLPETRVAAVFALLSTPYTRFDTRLILLMGHGLFPLFVEKDRTKSHSTSSVLLLIIVLA